MTLASASAQQALVFDFGVEKSFGNWAIINDGVMGGRSQSQAQLAENALLFEGDVSLRNNGGFVSIRSATASYDLSAFTTLEIRFKAETDRKFDLLLEPETAWYLPKVRTQFSAEGEVGEWRTLQVPLQDFEITRMGNAVRKGIDPAVLGAVRRIGIMLFDKQEGPFTLAVDYIKFF
ncbi:CIA30 family protein [Nitritalea halalkaliphila]|nr:CIA30 family protein [Nitritalea halalkaliphila]